MATTNVTATMETEGEWLCTAASDASLRLSLGLQTYRYLWAGNFTNISPVNYLGAYHWSDLLMIFGSYADAAGEITQLEVETSEKMQDFILAFLKNSSSLPTTLGWVPFDASDPDGGLIVEFGHNLPVQNITGDYVDGGCYNSSIPFPIWG